METAGYIASFVMGVTLGLLGGGGAILTVPIMVYLFTLPPTVATGYSLFVVGMTALIGGAIYLRRGEFDFKSGAAFALPSMLGVNVSRALILPAIPSDIVLPSGLDLSKEVLVLATFAILMIGAALSMIRRRPHEAMGTGPRTIRAAPMIAQGFVVGLLAGFVGAGGGFLIIPALVLLAGLAMRVAIGTSLMIIAFQSLVGFAGDVARGAATDWTLLTAVTSIAACGIVVGSAIAHKVKERQLKTAFGWFVLLMGSAILAEQIRHF